MNNINNQINRMKAMMTYGLTSENKTPYSTVEYQREGADGKLYGIVREGTKFYIKVSNKKKGALKEDFDYIGGFCNRKNNEFSSYGNALKHFDINMRSLNEAYNNHNNIIIESWNPDKKEELAVETTEKMRREIMRQREIMENAALIQEKKNYSPKNDCSSSCNKVDKECADSQKNNIKAEKPQTGSQLKQGGDPFKNKPTKAKGNSNRAKKNEFKPIVAENETLSWNENPDYLDTSSETKIGDTAPFNQCPEKGGKCNCTDPNTCETETVEEGTSMHDKGNCQNCPTPGVNKVGKSEPFDKKIHESIDDDMEDDSYDEDSEMDNDFNNDTDMDDTSMDDTEDLDTDLDDNNMDDNEDLDSELLDDEMPSDDFETDEEEFNNDTETRLTAMEDLLNKIAEKLGVSSFDDDKLYDDDSSDDDFDLDDNEEMPEDDYDEDMTSDDNEMPEDDYDEDMPSDNDMSDFDDEDEDTEVFESRDFRRVMKEDKLDNFGKHPAYQKKVMTLPNSSHSEKEGYFDMNDDEITNEKPYGSQIGDSNPFELDTETLSNAIQESIKRVLKKK